MRHAPLLCHAMLRVAEVLPGLRGDSPTPSDPPEGPSSDSAVMEHSPCRADGAADTCKKKKHGQFINVSVLSCLL